MTCSMRSVKRSTPTRSLFRIADIASTAASSLASSLLNLFTVPNRSEPERSTTSITVSSRSSMYRLTNGRRIRAVTFQSIERTSSPCKYSRTSENSIPWPLNTDRYSPVKTELTSPRVRSSISFTCRRISGGTPMGFSGVRLGASWRRQRERKCRSRNGYRFKDARDDLVARDLFCFGFVGAEHAVAQNVGRDSLHVVGRHERPPAKKGVGA